MKYAIITGTSRGLGASIAKQLLEKEIQIIGIARSENKELVDYSAEVSADYHHINCDLSDLEEVESIFSAIAQDIFQEGTEKVWMINNAGTVEPVNPAGQYDTAELTKHVNINLLAPMAAGNIFMKASEATGIHLTAVNVTSGAADRSVYGWSTYGSTKAGLNRYTSTVALEQEEKETGNIAILFNPGIMDTEMQETIRSNDTDAFKEVEKFKQYKENNSLREPATVASVLVSILGKETEIENGKNYSIYDYL